MTTLISQAEYARAAGTLRLLFKRPGATCPDSLDTAIEHPLWGRLLRARIAADRQQARTIARYARLAIHHGAQT